MSNVHPGQSVVPVRTEQANDVEDYARRVAAAVKGGDKLIDYGEHHQGLGGLPTSPGVHIAPPGGVLDHYVRDMTVRVAGGTRMDELSIALAEHGQHLPLDAPPTMTIAEAVAHNVYGPLACSAGTMRDLLLGLSYVDATGSLITVGGRTVKNVAGYDVTRLMVGSLNSLGLIAEATLRTVTIPQQVTHITITGAYPAAMSQQITDLLISDASPTWMQWRRIDREPVLQLAYAGEPGACDIQHDALMQWLEVQGWNSVEVERRVVDHAADVLERQSTRAAVWTSPAAVKVVVPPAATGKVYEALFKQPPSSFELLALPTLGVIHIAGELSAEEAVKLDAMISELINPHGGLRMWLTRPDGCEAIESFAPPQPDWPTLTRLKQALDPDNVFNHGRFL
ncbi:FAD-binding oxidoreductase [Planctomycetales bacterium ZRK34]|nr:FAD-binding oxidoreductase [Planctomycetales bacterium ZRK34]